MRRRPQGRASRSRASLFAGADSRHHHLPGQAGQPAGDVIERGTLESSENEDVYCQVEGQTTIISILPEGTRVKKGELVCELDSPALKDNSPTRRSPPRGPRPPTRTPSSPARSPRSPSTEYVEGHLQAGPETVQGEIALAEAEPEARRGPPRLVRAGCRRRAMSRRASTLRRAHPAAGELRARAGPDQEEGARKYTKDKTIKELKSEVEKAHSDELAKQATWELEKTKEAKLERQIKNCKILAPGDGLVVYANDPNRFGGSAAAADRGRGDRPRAAEDLQPARHQQDAGQHQGPRVDGRPDHARPARPDPVDAFARRDPAGVVTDVAPLPDPSASSART